MICFSAICDWSTQLNCPQAETWAIRILDIGIVLLNCLTYLGGKDICHDNIYAGDRQHTYQKKKNAKGDV